jgi:plastocyanin
LTPVRRVRALTSIGAVSLVVAVAAATMAQAPARAAIEATIVDDKGKAVDDAVVTVTPTGTAAPSRPAGGTATMDQVDREFTPHVLPVGVGTAVSFPNRDNIKHHVYSFSAPKKFELALYSGTPASPVVFERPGVVVLGCNIHDWMVAYVYVLTTPYFAKSGTDGKVRLGDVPPGTYEARVWHPRMRIPVEKTAQAVTVPGTERLAWTLVLKKEWKAPKGPGKYEGQPGS